MANTRHGIDLVNGDFAGVRDSLQALLASRTWRPHPGAVAVGPSMQPDQFMPPSPAPRSERLNTGETSAPPSLPFFAGGAADGSHKRKFTLNA